MTASAERARARLRAPLAIAGGAVLLRLISGVGFVNYDTLYALAWGGQLARGETPAYSVAIAPTPHPLLEALGVVLYPLGAHAAADVTVALAYLALSGCGWLIFRLGEEWFGAAAGALAAVIFLTRVPVLSYGVRAYVDLPYLLLVLGALLVETRSLRERGRPAGTRVLVLLAFAGLLRPEAWALSGLYWFYLTVPAIRARAELRLGATGASGSPSRSAWMPPDRAGAARIALLAAAAPLVWLLGDLAITGDPLWSLTHTRGTAATLDRVTGLANVPEYIPRRIGEILRPPVLVGAALGGVLSLLWLRPRALPGAIAGVVLVVVFAAFASLGLPINTRYAFGAAAILAVFCGAGVFGWLRLPAGDRRRRWWAIAGMVVLVGLVAYAPSQYRTAHRELDKLARQEAIEGDLVALVDSHAVTLRCGPVGVPNHAPVPLLALYLKTSPANVPSEESRLISRGVYVDPASHEVEQDYVLDPHDPHVQARVPPGFTAAGANRSWLVFHRCA
jgi:hypothetical protein